MHKATQAPPWSLSPSPSATRTTLPINYPYTLYTLYSFIHIEKRLSELFIVYVSMQPINSISFFCLIHISTLALLNWLKYLVQCSGPVAPALSYLQQTLPPAKSLKYGQRNQPAAWGVGPHFVFWGAASTYRGSGWLCEVGVGLHISTLSAPLCCGSGNIANYVSHLVASRNLEKYSIYKLSNPPGWEDICGQREQKVAEIIFSSSVKMTW